VKVRGRGFGTFVGMARRIPVSTQNGYARLYTSVLLPGGEARLNLLLVTQTWESGVVECLRDPSPAGALNPHFLCRAARPSFLDGLLGGVQL
jgi:hypothetical protein